MSEKFNSENNLNNVEETLTKPLYKELHQRASECIFQSLGTKDSDFEAFFEALNLMFQWIHENKGKRSAEELKVDCLGIIGAAIEDFETRIHQEFQIEKIKNSDGPHILEKFIELEKLLSEDDHDAEKLLNRELERILKDKENFTQEVRDFLEENCSNKLEVATNYETDLINSIQEIEKKLTGAKEQEDDYVQALNTLETAYKREQQTYNLLKNEGEDVKYFDEVKNKYEENKEVLFELIKYAENNRIELVKTLQEKEEALKNFQKKNDQKCWIDTSRGLLEFVQGTSKENAEENVMIILKNPAALVFLDNTFVDTLYTCFNNNETVVFFDAFFKCRLKNDDEIKFQLNQEFIRGMESNFGSRMTLTKKGWDDLKSITSPQRFDNR